MCTGAAGDIVKGFSVRRPDWVAAASLVFDGFGEGLLCQIVKPKSRSLRSLVSLSVGGCSIANDEEFFPVRGVAAISSICIKDDLFVFVWIEVFFDKAVRSSAAVIAVSADKNYWFGWVEILQRASFRVEGDLLWDPTLNGDSEDLF